MTIKDSLIGFLIVIIWGFNFVVIAWGIQDLPPLLMGAARFLMIAIIGSLFIRKPDIPWKWMSAYALVLCFGQFALLFSAIANGMPAGLASLVIQSQAVFTLILSALFLKESINANQLLAMLIAGIGLCVIGLSDEQSSMTLLGFVLTIIAAISWASGNIINRTISQKGYRAGLGLVVWSSWIAMIPFFFASFIFEGHELILSSLENVTTKTVLVIMYLAFAASVLGYSLWSYLLTHYPAGQVAPLTLGIPVVGILSASLLLDENISQQQFIGIALVMLGLIINVLGKKLKKIRAKKL